MDKNKVILYVLYGVLIVVLAYAIYATQGFGLWKSSSTTSSNGGYQAVFLSNGQVYFGKLKNLNSQFSTLEDIYYLQVKQQDIQPETSEDGNQLSLIKLGNELHGPDDKMQINRDHVLFVEDITDGGKVMEAIKQYQEEGPSGSTSVGE